jgi:hypothetical protein
MAPNELVVKLTDFLDKYSMLPPQPPANITSNPASRAVSVDQKPSGESISSDLQKVAMDMVKEKEKEEREETMANSKGKGPQREDYGPVPVPPDGKHARRVFFITS